MARPLSIDLRERVVDAVVRGGLSCRRRRRASALGRARRSPGWRGSGDRQRGAGPDGRPPAEADRSLAGVAAGAVPDGDFTLRGLVAELGERGMQVDYRTVWAFVHAEGLTQKKTLIAAERERPDVARRRAQWVKHQGKIDPSRLVFIDETWTKTNMAPLRGWAPRGERLKASVPHGHWNTMTFLAALRRTASRRPGSSTARSTAKASASTSSGSWCRAPPRRHRRHG